MNKATLTTAAIMAMSWILPMACGQSAATQPALPGGAMPLPSGGWGSYEEFFKVCEMDKDQIKKVADIEAKRKDNLDGYYKALADILAVLTPRQQAKWREYVLLKEAKACYADVKLTDEQWDKIMDACEKLAKDSTLRIGEVYAKVNSVLTAEQKAKWILSRAPFKEMDKVCHFTSQQIADLVPIEGERCKTAAELQAQKPLLWKAEREAMAAGDKNIVSVQPLWEEWHKHNNDSEAQFNDKLQSVMTGKQKADWTDPNRDKGEGKRTPN